MWKRHAMSKILWSCFSHEIQLIMCQDYEKKIHSNTIHNYTHRCIVRVYWHFFIWHFDGTTQNFDLFVFGWNVLSSGWWDACTVWNVSDCPSDGWPSRNGVLSLCIRYVTRIYIGSESIWQTNSIDAIVVTNRIRKWWHSKRSWNRWKSWRHHIRLWRRLWTRRSYIAQRCWILPT